MPPPPVAEYLQFAIWSALVTVAVMAVVAAVVGTLTYLLTRERTHPAPAGAGVVRVTAIPATPAARVKPVAEVPAAVAG
jgi:hypothetical protein